MNPAIPDQSTSLDEAESSRIKNWAPIGIAATFFILALIQMSHHVMWRDEIRTWQVCAPCTGLISLWKATRYEGVPVLWYWVVFALTRVTNHPFSMQLIHVAIATATVYTFARFAPFSLITKLIFPFGYFPFFEYAIITRNYAMVFLLLLIACVSISRPKLNLFALTAAMFLLTQVSIWGAGLGALMVLAGIARASFSSASDRPPKYAMIAAILVILVGMLLSYLEASPGPGSSFTATWQNASFGQRFMGMFAAVYRGWIPIPLWSEHFWNTNVLDYWPEASLVLQGIIGSMLFVFVCCLLSRRPIALAVLVLGGCALMAFEFIFRGFARHHGHQFMVLVIACWLANTTPALTPDNTRWIHFTALMERLRNPAFNVILVIGAFAGIAAAIGGLATTFSASRATAEYIRANFEPQINVVAVPDYCASPVAQWLGRPIYFPEMRTAAFYNTQDGQSRFQINLNSIIMDCANLVRANSHDAILVLASQISLPSDNMRLPLGVTSSGQPIAVSIVALGSFPQSVVGDEATKLYKISIVADSSRTAGR